MESSDLLGKLDSKASTFDCFRHAGEHGYDSLSSCAAGNGSNSNEIEREIKRLQTSDAMKALLPQLELQTVSNNGDVTKTQETKGSSEPTNVPGEVAKTAKPNEEQIKSDSSEKNPTSETKDQASGAPKIDSPLGNSELTLQDVFNWSKDQFNSATPEGVTLTSLLIRSQLTKIEAKSPVLACLNLETNIGAAFGAITLYKDANGFLDAQTSSAKAYYGVATASDAFTTIGGLAANIPGIRKYAVAAETAGLLTRAGLGLGSAATDMIERLWNGSKTPTDSAKNN